MGALIGGIIGGIGSLIGGHQQAQAADRATQASLTGYNYLTNGGGAPITNAMTTAGTQATQQQAALLGLGGDQAAAQQGFQNYLNSTGYNFTRDQGMDAITSNAATRGLLNSGSTIKGAEQYGQGLAGQYFNNYLGQLSGMAGQGRAAAGQVAGIGTSAGAKAGKAMMAGGDARARATTGALGSFTNALVNVPGLQAYPRAA